MVKHCRTANRGGLLQALVYIEDAFHAGLESGCLSPLDFVFAGCSIDFTKSFNHGYLGKWRQERTSRPFHAEHFDT